MAMFYRHLKAPYAWTDVEENFFNDYIQANSEKLQVLIKNKRDQENLKECMKSRHLVSEHDTCYISSQWRHNARYSISNHQPHDCLLNRLFRRRSKKTSKLRVTGLCAGNSPGTGELPTQMVSNAENVSIWWRHHGIGSWRCSCLVTWFCYQLIAKPGNRTATPP